MAKGDNIIMEFEVAMRPVYHPMRFVKTNNIRCIVNTAPAQPLDLQELRDADYFIPNESEAEVITGMPVHSMDEAKKCAAFLLHQGMRKVVITLGRGGSLVSGPGRVAIITAFTVQTLTSTSASHAS